MSEISMKELLEAGSHFGHQTRRWNPKMRKYIFGSRNGIYIIDLQKTLNMTKDAAKFVTESVANGGKILFVGTKKQAQTILSEEAEKCNSFYINKRWLGGTLTNFQTVSKSIARLKELKSIRKSGAIDVLPKKEAVVMDKQIEKLMKYLGGIEDMTSIPDLMFIIDPHKEKNALAEARRLGIKTVAIVDTNCDPDGIDYIIPSNDDAVRAIKLVTSYIGDAVRDGLEVFSKKQKEREEKAREEKAAKTKKDKMGQKIKTSAKKINNSNTEENKNQQTVTTKIADTIKKVDPPKVVKENAEKVEKTENTQEAKSTPKP